MTWLRKALAGMSRQWFGIALISTGFTSGLVVGYALSFSVLSRSGISATLILGGCVDAMGLIAGSVLSAWVVSCVMCSAWLISLAIRRG